MNSAFTLSPRPARRHFAARIALTGAALVLGLWGHPALAQDPASDWPNLGAYRQANQELVTSAPDNRRVVFMGDSITEFWDKDRAHLFADSHYVNRGISGQTTGQMLLRFRQDVIALHPKAVVILAGTNDIAGNNGPASDAEIEGNIASMAELAKANGIKVVLATLVPADHYEWAPEIQPVPRIAAINAWLRDYARRNHLALCDYYPALATAEGALPAELGPDGVHPNLAGYAVMERLVLPLLKRVQW